MARRAFEGYTAVWWIPTELGIGDITAPTTAELGLGTDISTFVTKDGVNTPQNQNMVDNASIADIFDAQTVGSWGGSLELTAFRDDAADDAWDLFNYGDVGYVVIRRLVPYDQAWAADDVCEVYPAQMHEPINNASAANENTRFKATCAVTRTPELNAVVV